MPKGCVRGEMRSWSEDTVSLLVLIQSSQLAATVQSKGGRPRQNTSLSDGFHAI